MRTKRRDYTVEQWYKSQRRRCRSKGWEWQLTLEETEQLWGARYWDRWPDGLSRWHVWRRDPTQGWTLSNTELITSGESGRRKQQSRGLYANCNPDPDPWYMQFPVECEIEGRRYQSINEAARELGCSATTVRYRMSRERWPLWRRVSGGKSD